MGHNVRKQPSGFIFIMDGERQVTQWKPSEAWAQGGPIIYREKIDICNHHGTDEVSAIIWFPIKHVSTSTTPLIAAMRCFVASRLGDEVEIPEELI
jgi:hypothetical protein